MRCEQCRETISAGLDGEDTPAERAGAETHLAGCADCRRWRDAAIVVTRLARTGPAMPGRGVDDAVLAAAPGPARRPLAWLRPGRRAAPSGGAQADGGQADGKAAGGKSASRLRPLAWRRGGRLTLLLRAGLGALGLGQFLLGLAQVAGVTTGHVHAGLGVSTNHLWHESAAWNVAVGAGFVWVALHRSRPTGILPTLTAFVAVLGLLSVNDVIAGRVDSVRLLSHGFLLAGYLIIMVLSRRQLDPGEPPAGNGARPSRWRARFDDEPAEPGPGLRLLPGLTAEATASTRRAA